MTTLAQRLAELRPDPLGIPARAEPRLDPEDKPFWMLSRLGTVAMKALAKLELAIDGALSDDERAAILGRTDLIDAYVKIGRAVRQIVAMEAKLYEDYDYTERPDFRHLSRILAKEEDAGGADDTAEAADTREPSDLRERSDLGERSDLADRNDLDDYDRRPMGEALAALTRTVTAQAEALGVSADELADGGNMLNALANVTGYTHPVATARAFDAMDRDTDPLPPTRSRGPP